MKQSAIINEKRLLERFWGSWLSFSDLGSRSIYVRSVVVLVYDCLIGEGLTDRVEIFYATDFVKLSLPKIVYMYIIGSYINYCILNFKAMFIFRALLSSKR